MPKVKKATKAKKTSSKSKKTASKDTPVPEVVAAPVAASQRERTRRLLEPTPPPRV